LGNRDRGFIPGQLIPDISHLLKVGFVGLDEGVHLGLRVDVVVRGSLNVNVGNLPVFVVPGYLPDGVNRLMVRG
jgi:hypothetical protein